MARPLSVPRGTVVGMAVVEVAPDACPNGHPFGPNRVIVGWLPCQCVEGRAGHRTYWCRTCRVTLYVPPHEATGEAEAHIASSAAENDG